MQNNILTLHLTDDLGVSDAAAGALFGLRGTLTMTYGTLLGPAIDHFGAMRVLPLAFFLAAVGRGMFAVATSLPVALFALYGPMVTGGIRGRLMTVSLHLGARSRCHQRCSQHSREVGHRRACNAHPGSPTHQNHPRTTVVSTPASTSRPPGDSTAEQSWGFAFSYCALVLGIVLCGPAIDVASSLTRCPRTPPLPPRCLEQNRSCLPCAPLHAAR